MKRALASALILSAFIAAASAQIWIMSPSGGGRANGSGIPVPPPTPCGDATFDLTDSCNLVYYIGGIF